MHDLYRHSRIFTDTYSIFEYTTFTLWVLLKTLANFDLNDIATEKHSRQESSELSLRRVVATSHLIFHSTICHTSDILHDTDIALSLSLFSSISLSLPQKSLSHSFLLKTFTLVATKPTRKDKFRRTIGLDWQGTLIIDGNNYMP